MIKKVVLISAMVLLGSSTVALASSMPKIPNGCILPPHATLTKGKTFFAVEYGKKKTFVTGNSIFLYDKTKMVCKPLGPGMGYMPMPLHNQPGSKSHSKS